MDSEIQRDGRVLDLTDDAWREDRLPYEDVTIPLSELPEAEQDNGGSTESVKEQEMKWTDLALQSLHENTPSTGSWRTNLGSDCWKKTHMHTDTGFKFMCFYCLYSFYCVFWRISSWAEIVQNDFALRLGLYRNLHKFTKQLQKKYLCNTINGSCINNPVFGVFFFSLLFLTQTASVLLESILGISLSLLCVEIKKLRRWCAIPKLLLVPLCGFVQYSLLIKNISSFLSYQKT